MNNINVYLVTIFIGIYKIWLHAWILFLNGRYQFTMFNLFLDLYVLSLLISTEFVNKNDRKYCFILNKFLYFFTYNINKIPFPHLIIENLANKNKEIFLINKLPLPVLWNQHQPIEPISKTDDLDTQGPEKRNKLEEPVRSPNQQIARRIISTRCNVVCRISYELCER